MRRFIAILVVSTLSIVGLCAQRITFRDSQVSVGQAIDAIREQARHTVSYNKSLLDLTRRITVTVGGMEMLALLDVLVAGEGVDYVIRNEVVVFIPAAKQPDPPIQPEEQSIEIPVVTEFNFEPAVRLEPLARLKTYTVTLAKPLPRAAKPLWFGLKTNLLYDAAVTPNLAFEIRTGGRMSIDMPVSYNAWEWQNYRKWKHILVQPGLRLWARETFGGHFFGLHAHYAFYNVGNLHKFFSPYMQAHRFEGWLAGAGVSWGYRWNFSRRAAMEVELGVGYARMEYDKYECVTCNDFVGSETKNYFGPTKAAVNMILAFGGKLQSRRKSRPIPVDKIFIPSPALVDETVAAAVRSETVIATATHKAAALELAPSFVTPMPRPANERTESGRIYLDFPEGSDVLLPGFRNNAAELARMHKMADGIREDSNSRITAVRLRGYASPEGSWQDNKELSQRRVKALQSYVQANIGLAAATSDATGEGEDWHGLYCLVNGSDMLHRDDVMKIIEIVDIFKGREKQLMELSGGAPYRYMKEHMFPLLRRVDYHFDYTSADATHAAPDLDADNINAAAEALLRRDTDTAVEHLFKVSEQSLAWWNNMGVMFYLRGEMERAAACFYNAGAEGEENAEKLQEYLNK